MINYDTLGLIPALFLMVAGFGMLIKGSDFFVDGSASIAKRFHIPTLIVGMTIVAMGTSLPELSVSTTASIAGQNSLALSNIIGSNIFNLLVVLGACTIFTELDVEKFVIRRDFPIQIGTTVLLLALCMFGSQVGRVDGAVLLAVFVVWIVLMCKAAIKGSREEIANEFKGSNGYDLNGIVKDIIFVIGGAAAVGFGGNISVGAFTVIARTVGISETLIGLTIASVGTSLPELVTSIMAARKNELDMAIGNAVGSSIFNVLMIIGTASVVSPIAVIKNNYIDMLVLLLVSVVTMSMCASDSKLDKNEGKFMLAMYGGYLCYIFFR